MVYQTATWTLDAAATVSSGACRTALCRACCATPRGLSRPWRAASARDRAPTHPPSLQILSASAAFYAVLWNWPGAWARLVAPRDPSSAMAAVAHALKFIQIVAVACVTDWKAARALSPVKLLCAAALLLVGQHLNALVRYAQLERLPRAPAMSDCSARPR